MSDTNSREIITFLYDDEITKSNIREMQGHAVKMLREIADALDTEEEQQVAMVMNCSIKERPDLLGSGLIGYPGACRHLAQSLFNCALSLPHDMNFEPTILFERKDTGNGRLGSAYELLRNSIKETLNYIGKHGPGDDFGYVIFSNLNAALVLSEITASDGGR